MLAMSDTSVEVDGWRLDPPKEILHSRLFAAGGYLVVSGLFNEDTLQALRAEADRVRSRGERGCVAESDGTEGRGGTPGRAYRLAGGGDLHYGLYGCQKMTEALGQLCGATVRSTGGGSYSYYEHEGDFLALHRDVLQCDIAVITCLSQSMEGGRAGELAVYPQYIHEPLSTARGAGISSSTVVPLDWGQTALLLGGIVPHEVTPMCAGQDRIVAVNCYRVQTADSHD